MPPIDYKALAIGIQYGRLEQMGIDSGYFIRSGTDIASPQEAKSARRNAGLDRKRFAEALGVTKKTIEEWEKGDRFPDGLATKVLRRILKRPAFIKELAQTQ